MISLAASCHTANPITVSTAATSNRSITGAKMARSRVVTIWAVNAPRFSVWNRWVSAAWRL